MHLTRHTDYSLRVLYYLGLNPDRRVSIGEISEAFGASRNHLVKVVQNLAREGFVKTVRGRTGGVRLALPPEQIRIGRVVALTEPGFRVVECFDPKTNTCPIAALCGLQGVVERGLAAFLAELDRHTLAEVVAARGDVFAALGTRSPDGDGKARG